MRNRNTTHNSRFAKAGVWCFYDSEVLNSSFVHLMKFSAENPRLRKAAKRYAQCYDDSATDEHCSLTSNFCVKLHDQMRRF